MFQLRRGISGRGTYSGSMGITYTYGRFTLGEVCGVWGGGGLDGGLWWMVGG